MSVGSKVSSLLKNLASPFLRIPSPYRIAGGGIALLLVILVMAVIFSGGRGWLSGMLLFLIASLVIALLLFLVNRFLAWRASKRAAALSGALSQEHEKEVGVSSEARQQQLAEIKSRWDQAISELRRANLSLYQLPWFLLIGEPGAGKSTTLLNSGLEFPVGRDRLSGAGGTRNCDWWFTNHAVILDTAGRYAFNQSDAPDASEWTEFLRLMKRHRPACPINGVILTIPATALLGESREEREAKAKRLRQKLEEVQAVLEIQFPVFVLVTKADRLLGFTEFFLQLPSMEQRQLFGWSRPGEYSRPFELEELDEGFAGLSRDLRRWRLKLLEEDLPPQQRDRLYALPDEFDSLETPLRDYLGEIFKQNVFSETLYLRGIYFTSGLQKGRPIVKACAQLVSGASHGPDEKDLSEIFEKPRTFFVRDFYRRKVFPEAGLVNPSSQSVKRQAFLGKLVYGLGGTAAALVLLISLFGFFSGDDRYTTLQNELEEVARFPEVRTASLENKSASYEKALLRATRLGRAREELASPGVVESLFRLLVVADADLAENVEATYEGFVVDELATPFLEDAIAALGRGDLATSEPLIYQRALRTILRLAAASAGHAPGGGDPWSLEPLYAYANARGELERGQTKDRVPLDDRGEDSWGFATAWRRAVQDTTDIGQPLHESPRQRLSTLLAARLDGVANELRRQVVQQTWQRLLAADLTFPYEQLDELIPASPEAPRALTTHQSHRQLAAAAFLDAGIGAVPKTDTSWELARLQWAVWPGRDEPLGWTYASAKKILANIGGPLPEPAPILDSWRKIADRYLEWVFPATKSDDVLGKLRSAVKSDLGERLSQLEPPGGLPSPSAINAFCPQVQQPAPNVGARLLIIQPSIKELLECLPQDWLGDTAVLDEPASTGELAAFEQLSLQLASRLDSLKKQPDMAKLEPLEAPDPLRPRLQVAYERFQSFSEASPQALASAAAPRVVQLGLESLEPKNIDWDTIQPSASEYKTEAVAGLRERVARWFDQLTLLESHAETGSQRSALRIIRVRLEAATADYAEDLQSAWLATLRSHAAKLDTFQQQQSNWSDYRRAANSLLPGEWLGSVQSALQELASSVAATKPLDGWVESSPVDAALKRLESFAAEGNRYLDDQVAKAITSWVATIEKLDSAGAGKQQADGPTVVGNLQKENAREILAAFEIIEPNGTSLSEVAADSLRAPIYQAFQAGLPLLATLISSAFETEWQGLGQAYRQELDGYPLVSTATEARAIKEPDLRRFLNPLDGTLPKLLVKYRGLYPAEFAQELVDIYGSQLGGEELPAQPYHETVVLDDQALGGDRRKFIQRAAMLGKALFDSPGKEISITLKWFPTDITNTDLIFEARSANGGYLYSFYEIIGMAPKDDEVELKMRWVASNRDRKTEALWSVDRKGAIRIVGSGSDAAEPKLFESSENWSLLDLVYRPQHAAIIDREIQLKIPVVRNEHPYYFTMTLTDLPAPFPDALPSLRAAGWN